MKCPNCKHEVKKNSKFCVRCGTPLEETKNRNNMKLIAIALIILALIIISALALSNMNSNTTQDNKSTENTVTINNILFNIPNEGYFKDYNQYRFNYSDSVCAIKNIDPFERSTSYTIDSVKLSKYYPGAQTYVLYTYHGETWYGIEFKKENTWFHASILTTNTTKATKFFDWMYDNNEWEGHE